MTYQVLSLKWRPTEFNQVIGQSHITQALSNAIKLNRLAHAFTFSGPRGVGKTTTARILAKKINDLTNLSDSLDVIEMDAASNRGIDEIRNLKENINFAPAHGKYKIYIIDEVHMLSKQAFNGLLKTLEEPPPHLKFIFATTEVKKIPITIVSRCQRFDLHRVPILNLFDNLKRISKIENGKISDKALNLIAKAAEGSVRDSLSLLDRALISQNINQKEIDEIFVRKMLGIADRSKILELLTFIFEGDQKKSIELLKLMIDEGLEASNFLNDILEIIYFILRKKNLGNFESDLFISEAELKTIDIISKDLDTSILIIFWQFILKGLEELSIVSNPILSLEMLIIRLIHLKDMPTYEGVLENLNGKNLEEIPKSAIGEIEKTSNVNEKKKSSKDQIKNIVQTKPETRSLKEENLSKDGNKSKILSFENLINMASNKREVELKYDLEKNVNLIKFSEGKIDISFNENLSKNFVRTLSERLFEWTGKRWVITLAKETGQKTFSELQSIKKSELIEKEKKSETFKKIKTIFNDAELLEVFKKNTE